MPNQRGKVSAEPARPLSQPAGGIIRSQAVVTGIGISQQGYHRVLGVELAERESHSSWRGVLAGL
jgi:transposase-like protein